MNYISTIPHYLIQIDCAIPPNVSGGVICKCRKNAASIIVASIDDGGTVTNSELI